MEHTDHYSAAAQENVSPQVANIPKASAEKRHTKSRALRDAMSDEVVAKLAKELEPHGITVNKVIAKGSQGVVLKCFRTLNGQQQPISVKVQTQGDPGCTYNEVLRQIDMQHPHVVKLYSVVRTPSFLCLAMEHANGGDVFRLVKRAGGLPEAAARFLFQQLILALDYLHRFEHFIRDVKPSNLLVFWNSSGMPILKITDFNLAKDTDVQSLADTGTPSRTSSGCTMYTSPQVLRNRGKPYAAMTPFAPLCDVWSAAVTLYYSLYATWPFSKEAILSWSNGAAVDVDQVLFKTKTKDGDVSEGAIRLMKTIFGLGNTPAHELPEVGQHVAVKSIIRSPWFKQDLPPGTADMTAMCYSKTLSWRTSTDHERVRGRICAAAKLAGAAASAQQDVAVLLPESQATASTQATGR